MIQDAIYNKFQNFITEMIGNEGDGKSMDFNNIYSGPTPHIDDVIYINCSAMIDQNNSIIRVSNSNLISLGAAEEDSNKNTNLKYRYIILDFSDTPYIYDNVTYDISMDLNNGFLNLDMNKDGQPYYIMVIDSGNRVIKFAFGNPDDNNKYISMYLNSESIIGVFKDDNGRWVHRLLKMSPLKGGTFDTTVDGFYTDEFVFSNEYVIVGTGGVYSDIHLMPGQKLCVKQYKPPMIKFAKTLYNYTGESVETHIEKTVPMLLGNYSNGILSINESSESTKLRNPYKKKTPDSIFNTNKTTTYSRSSLTHKIIPINSQTGELSRLSHCTYSSTGIGTYKLKIKNEGGYNEESSMIKF